MPNYRIHNTTGQSTVILFEDGTQFTLASGSKVEIDASEDHHDKVLTKYGLPVEKLFSFESPVIEPQDAITYNPPLDNNDENDGYDEDENNEEDNEEADLFEDDKTEQPNPAPPVAVATDAGNAPSDPAPEKSEDQLDLPINESKDNESEDETDE